MIVSQVTKAEYDRCSGLSEATKLVRGAYGFR